MSKVCEQDRDDMKLMVKYISSALEILILFFTLKFLNPYLAYLALNWVREVFIDKPCSSQVGCHSYNSMWFGQVN